MKRWRDGSVEHDARRDPRRNRRARGRARPHGRAPRQRRRSPPTCAASSRCSRTAVLEVHDRQMPLMIALQRGDDSLDDLRELATGRRRRPRAPLRGAVAPQEDRRRRLPRLRHRRGRRRRARITARVRRAEGDVQRPAARHRRRPLRRHLGRSVAPRRQHRRSRPRTDRTPPSHGGSPTVPPIRHHMADRHPSASGAELGVAVAVAVTVSGSPCTKMPRRENGISSSSTTATSSPRDLHHDGLQVGRTVVAGQGLVRDRPCTRRDRG